jgi:predicted RNA-binding protein with PIN domain
VSVPYCSRYTKHPFTLLYNILNILKGRPAISLIIIDGYNLIGVHHADLEKQREALINSLIEYRKRKNHDITVVFDGWKTGEARESRYVTGGIRIIYSRIGEKADSVIKRMISSGGKEWIVVTSDREIADHAWSSGSVPVPADAFLEAAGRKTPAFLPEDDEEDYPEPRRKGNPRKPSKKEKALKRALSKL